MNTEEIKFTCNICGQRVAIEEKAAEGIARCPSCEGYLIVPKVRVSLRVKRWLENNVVLLSWISLVAALVAVGVPHLNFLIYWPIVGVCVGFASFALFCRRFLAGAAVIWCLAFLGPAVWYVSTVVMVQRSVVQAAEDLQKSVEKNFDEEMAKLRTDRTNLARSKRL